MQHRETEINGQQIAYYESNGTGRSVLLVHGNSMSGRCFQRQLESPLGDQFHLVAIDLPGHGRSEPAQSPESVYTLPGYAALVSEFVRKHALDEAVLVGWSMGGHILLEASGQLPGAAGLMIFGTPPVGKPMSGDAFIPNPLTHVMFTSTVSDEEAVAAVSGFFMQGSNVPGFFIEDFQRTDGRVRETVGRSVMAENYTDEVVVVAGFKRPLAIIHGSHEPLANLSYIKNLKIPSLWRGDVQTIAGAGHTPQWEQPESFNRLLTEFVVEC